MEYTCPVEIMLSRLHHLIKCANDVRDYEVKYFVFFLKYFYILFKQIF